MYIIHVPRGWKLKGTRCKSVYLAFVISLLGSTLFENDLKKKEVDRRDNRELWSIKEAEQRLKIKIRPFEKQFLITCLKKIKLNVGFCLSVMFPSQ